MLGKSERRRIHGLILATLLHGGGPLLMVFLAERPTPTTRQVSSGGPPPQVLRDPGQPRQWDWMRDDKIHSTTWEWDNASPSDMWKHTQCADTFPKASRPTRKNRSTAKPAASTPRTEGRRFRLGHRSVRPEVRPSMRSRVDARVPAGQVQRR